MTRRPAVPMSCHPPRGGCLDSFLSICSRGIPNNYERCVPEDRYEISRTIKGTIPLFSPYELWGNPGGSYVKLEGRKSFPVGAVSRRRTVYCNEADGWLIYDSDRFGFNNDPATVDEVVGGTKRLDSLFVGESFVNGGCVPPDNNLQRSLTRLGRLALGFGIGGNSPMMYLATIKEYAKQVRPKHIMFMYYEGNDLPQVRADLTTEMTHYLEPGFEVGAAQHQEEVDNFLLGRTAENYANLEGGGIPAHSFADFARLSHLRGRVASLIAPADRPCEWDFSEYKSTGELDWLIKTVLEAKRYSNELGAKFHFVYEVSVNGLLHKCNYAKDDLVDQLRKSDVDVIDLSEVFLAPQPRFELFSLGRLGGHYSKKGYSVVAQLIDNRTR